MGAMRGMCKSAVTAALKDQALRLGFELVGVAPAVPSPDFAFLQQWISAGFAGEMEHFLPAGWPPIVTPPACSPTRRAS